MNIPHALWNNLIIVPNRDKFLNSLKTGVLTDYKFVNDLPVKELRELVNLGWKTIKFGKNCVLPN
jgi:hypothetical protein